MLMRLTKQLMTLLIDLSSMCNFGCVFVCCFHAFYATVIVLFIGLLIHVCCLFFL